jgi:DNA-directed RNA polymerase subunit K/omega
MRSDYDDSLMAPSLEDLRLRIPARYELVLASTKYGKLLMLIPLLEALQKDMLEKGRSFPEADRELTRVEARLKHAKQLLRELRKEGQVPREGPPARKPLTQALQHIEDGLVGREALTIPDSLFVFDYVDRSLESFLNFETATRRPAGGAFELEDIGVESEEDTYIEEEIDEELDEPDDLELDAEVAPAVE